MFKSIFYLIILSCFLITEVRISCMNKETIIHFPKPTGAYGVGTTAYHLIDESRNNEFSDDPQFPQRELMIQLWYPIQEASSDAPSIPYAPDAMHYWKKKINVANTNAQDKFESLEKIFVYAKPDAPLAYDKAPFPVLIFAQGFGQMRTSNTALYENVASYGYVVTSIDYPYFSENVTFPDGRSVSNIPFNFDSIEQEQHLQNIFIDDVKFVVKKLEELNSKTDSIFYKSLDLYNMGIFGHSIGSSTALFATKHLDQIKAGINIDGSILGNKDLLVNFNKPFMHILAGDSVKWAIMLRTLNDEQLIKYGFKSRDDFNEKNERGIFLNEKLHEHQASDVYRVIIHGAGHMSFCDAIFLKDNDLLKPLLYLGFGIGSLSGEKITELTTRCIVTFFDKYLKNKDDIEIEKVITIFPEIEIQKK